MIDRYTFRKLKGPPATERQVRYIVMEMRKYLTDEERHSVLMWLAEVESTKSLNKAQATQLIDWLVSGNPEPTLRLILRERLKEQGQIELPIEET